MAEFQKAAKTNEIVEGDIKVARLGNEEIALYKINGEILATNNLCTHEYCLLNENHNIEGEEVECTCHGSKFNIRTGENTFPPAAENLPVYKTKIEGDDVYVKVN